MPTRSLLLVAAFLGALSIARAVPHAQSGADQSGTNASDLDAFMNQVLTRRDDNWKKLRQYTLEEHETLQVSALSGRKLYGFKREYTWFPNDAGVFVRSPISADGVKLSEADRRKAEAKWIEQEERRGKPRAKHDGETEVHADTDDGARAPGLNDLVKPGNEPRFVSSAYFMKFKFDAGSYALAGREKLLGLEVLKVEYYPHQYFRDPPRRAGQGQKRGKGEEIGDALDRKMDKVSMITLWIEPAGHQILQYEFSNIDFDFMPGRALVRLDDLRASMRMREAFPQVWLPDTITMAFGMSLALGDVGARYDVKYHDYKLAEVKTRLR